MKKIPALMDDFEGFKTSVEDLQVEPKDVTELLQSHDEALMVEELPLTDERREWIVEVTGKGSEYDVT